MDAQLAADLSDGFLDRYRLAALIQAVEDDLRSFIRQYVTPYSEPEHVLADKCGELRRRARADGVVDPGFDALVDYLDFGDAFALLNRHRAMLPDALAQTIRSLTPALEVAVPIRNRVMHGRPLRADDEEQVARLGQSIAEASGVFASTRGVVAHLIEDPSWAPLIEISSTPYGNVLHNLPLPEFDETGLLGRDDELRQVRDLLLRRRYPVVTIAGEGGIGKTALAVQVLYDLVDSADAPFEAVLWASLKTERLTGRGVQHIRDAAVDLMSVTGALITALGDSGNPDIAMLADVLEGTSALIAIDNVESIGADEIRELIDAIPDAQFLLTSRVGLGEIERRLVLGALGGNAAKIMLRQLGGRRGQPQLARMTDHQADRVVKRLRASPLAIRWFVEAVQAGGQPDDLVRDQSAVLQFCMSTIYDSLALDARKLVDAMVAVESSATIGQLALLTDLDRDEVQDQMYELQRRAIVQVDSRLSETLTQSYALSAMAREYLRRFGSLDSAFSEQIRRRLREIATTDEVIRQFDNQVALEPMAIAVETPEERAVANVLRDALRKSKRGDIDGARAGVGRARDAVPAFFETYRVGAFIESDVRPEEARRLYEEAYRLAPERARPKVAYWLAGHLANMMSAGEAEKYAREAHEALGLPGTALRLGRICMFEGQRFDEAGTLLEVAARAEHTKTRVIAETSLLNLAERRIEHLAHDERMPVAALEAALSAVGRAEAFLDTGVVDRRYHEQLAEVVSEGLLVALRLPDVDIVSDELTSLLEAIDRNFPILARPGLRNEWTSRLSRICARADCPEDLELYGKKLDTRLQGKLALVKAGRATGEVLEYSARKRYGFIQPADGGENVFFHQSSVRNPHDCLLLTRGVEVTYSPQEQEREGERRLRAEDVTVVASEAARERALKRRRARVVHRDQDYLFAEDTPTQERIFVNRSAFQNGREWNRVREGDVLSIDVEFNRRGARAVSRSVTINREGE